MEDLTVSVAERQTKIRARLKKFFNRRPTMESLVKKGIWKGKSKADACRKGPQFLFCKFLVLYLSHPFLILTQMSPLLVVTWNKYVEMNSQKYLYSFSGVLLWLKAVKITWRPMGCIVRRATYPKCKKFVFRYSIFCVLLLYTNIPFPSFEITFCPCLIYRWIRITCLP